MLPKLDYDSLSKSVGMVKTASANKTAAGSDIPKRLIEARLEFDYGNSDDGRDKLAVLSDEIDPQMGAKLKKILKIMEEDTEKGLDELVGFFQEAGGNFDDWQNALDKSDNKHWARSKKKIRIAAEETPAPQPDPAAPQPEPDSAPATDASGDWAEGKELYAAFRPGQLGPELDHAAWFHPDDEDGQIKYGEEKEALIRNADEIISEHESDIKFLKEQQAKAGQQPPTPGASENPQG